MSLTVNIKKLHPDAVIPKYAKPGDAGMDLVATSKIYDKYGNVSYGVGLGFEIPDGYVGLLFPRSSNSKQDILLSNSVGVLDSGYRGEVFFKFKPSAAFVDEQPAPSIDSDTFDRIELPNPSEDWDFSVYKVGERIGQIIILPYPKVVFNEVNELSPTIRGAGGFGSSGK
jgi:dUTP pyrophosphatase